MTCSIGNWVICYIGFIGVITIMGIDVHLPTLGLVVGSAAVDSINPCAIGF